MKGISARHHLILRDAECHRGASCWLSTTSAKECSPPINLYGQRHGVIDTEGGAGGCSNETDFVETLCQGAMNEL